MALETVLTHSLKFYLIMKFTEREKTLKNPTFGLKQEEGTSLPIFEIRILIKFASTVRFVIGYWQPAVFLPISNVLFEFQHFLIINYLLFQ